jgi:hypothetical protein
VSGEKKKRFVLAWEGRFDRVVLKIQILVFVVARQAHRLSGDLVVGSELTANLGAGQDVLTVLVKLELGDDDVGGVDAQRDGLAVGLVTGDTLDVDNVLETVHGGDLALTALVGATNNGDLVVLSDGDRADLGNVRTVEKIRRQNKN